MRKNAPDPSNYDQSMIKIENVLKIKSEYGVEVI